MDAERSSSRREKAVVGIKEEDGLRCGDRGQEAVQEGRDARSLTADKEMGVAKRQATKECIKGRQSGREGVGVQREVRRPANRQ